MRRWHIVYAILEIIAGVICINNTDISLGFFNTPIIIIGVLCIIAGLIHTTIFMSQEDDEKYIYLRFKEFLNYYEIAPEKYRILRYCGPEYAHWKSAYSYKGNKYNLAFIFLIDYFRYWVFKKQTLKHKISRNNLKLEYLGLVQKDIDILRNNLMNNVEIDKVNNDIGHISDPINLEL